MNPLTKAVLTYDNEIVMGDFNIDVKFSVSGLGIFRQNFYNFGKES